MPGAAELTDSQLEDSYCVPAVQGTEALLQVLLPRRGKCIHDSVSSVHAHGTSHHSTAHDGTARQSTARHGTDHGTAQYADACTAEKERAAAPEGCHPNIRSRRRPGSRPACSRPRPPVCSGTRGSTSAGESASTLSSPRRSAAPPSRSSRCFDRDAEGVPCILTVPKYPAYLQSRLSSASTACSCSRCFNRDAERVSAI